MDDPLKDEISKINSSNACNILQARLSEVFKFLRWKLAHYVHHFPELDKYIVNTNAFDEFTKLSCKSCSYSKLCIKLYTENLWQGSVVNQWLSEC